MVASMSGGGCGLRELSPLTTSDGRTLTWCEVGPAQGRVAALYLHGTGSSRLEVAPYAAAAEHHGIRIVAWDRPRHGGSTPLEGRKLRDVLADAQLVIEASAADRPAAIGLSGGGDHALTLGALAPLLVSRVVTINAGAPPVPEILAAMPAQMARLIRLASERPRVFAAIARVTQSQHPLLRRLAERQLEPEDRAVLADPVMRPLLEAAAAQGSRQPGAWIEEARMFWGGGPWDFSLTPFPVPLDVFTGTKDPFRPFALSLERAGATLHEFPGGHGSGFTPMVLDEVIRTAILPTS